MELSKSILEDMRAAVGLNRDSVDFDTDLIMHINSALATLSQNGVGLPTVITDTSLTWGDFQDPNQVEGNLYFQYVPLYVAMSTKLIFDPPPPSLVESYNLRLSEILWRLKVSYEDFTRVTTTTTVIQ